MTSTKEPVVEAPTNNSPGQHTFRVLILDTPEHADQLKTACKEAGHAVVVPTRSLSRSHFWMTKTTQM